MNKINFLIIIIFLISACSEQTDIHYLVETKDVSNFPADSIPFFSKPEKLIIKENKIFVLDGSNQRIVIFDKDFNYLNQIGRKGAGPGEFISPSSFEVFKDILYVYDASKFRIDVITLDGEYLRSFRPKYQLFAKSSFCINSLGKLFINHPLGNNLITVYDEYGEVIESFGNIIENPDPYLKISMNNVFVAIDEHDNIYASFVMLPILRKYDKNKNLLWEKDLSKYNEIKQMHDFIVKKRENNPEQKYNLFYLSKDIYYQSPFLYILFQGVVPYGNTVYAFSQDGELKKIFRISKGDIHIDSLHNYGNLAVDKTGIIYLSDKTEGRVVKFHMEN